MPFGFFLATDIKQFANRGLIRWPVWFSPDGKFLISGDDKNALRVNLTSFAKENFASPLRNRMNSIAGLAQNDRALLLDRSKSESPSVVSFSTGELISNLSVQADSAGLCTNSRFAVLRKNSESSIQLADLSSNTAIPLAESVSADAYGNEIVVLKKDGVVLFFEYGDPKPVLGARLPLGSLPPLHASAVDAGLTSLSLSVPGAGGTFDVASGRSLLEQKPFVGTQIADSKQPLFLVQPKSRSPHVVLGGDLDAHAARPLWTATPDAEILSGEGAFLEYSISAGPLHVPFGLRDSSGVAFKLRGLNPSSGAQLWHAGYEEEVPIPFSDPQGGRFVLGWKAKTSGARNAVRNNAVILDAFKHSKRVDQDSVFEVFDSTTGKIARRRIRSVRRRSDQFHLGIFRR